MPDESQWSFLIAAIGRIEARLEKLAESDTQKSAAILTIKDDLHRVEKAHEAQMNEQRLEMERRLSPMENIAEKVRAGKIVAMAIVGAFLTISGILGAWSTIKDWFFIK